jgi:hypothetical protein
MEGTRKARQRNAIIFVGILWTSFILLACKWNPSIHRLAVIDNSRDEVTDWLLGFIADTTDRGVNTIGHEFRLFKRLHARKNRLTGSEPRIYTLLNRKLFSWLPSNITVDAIAEYQPIDRGIVMPVGVKNFAYAVHLIRCIRMYGCRLPILISFLGDEDLPVKMQDFFLTLPGVDLRDLSSYVNKGILQLKGWDIKPYSMLLNPFKEMLFLDADIILVQNPEVLFEYPEYKETGAVFFKDRMYGGGAHYPGFISQIVPLPHSKQLRETPMFRGKSQNHMESGVIAFDKSRRLMGLLAVCKLNNPYEREFIHKHTHGDKETFWLGFEIAEEPYKFLEPRSGMIAGEIKVKDGKESLLGKIAHFDGQGQMIWFHGGIIENKYQNNKTFANLTTYAWEGESSWDFYPEEGKVHFLSPQQATLFDKIRDLWEVDPLNSTKRRASISTR